ncbi:hypothetical protein OROHE_010363 [Orobanche hederae]
MQLIHTAADLFITVPAVATRVVLPVLNCVSPLLLKLFPNMLSTAIIRKTKEQEATKRKKRQQQTREELFWLDAVVAIFAMSLMEFVLPKMAPPSFGDKIEEQETMRRKLKAKLEYVRFLQDTTREMVRQILSSRSGDIKQTAEELDEFIDKVKRGATVSVKETMDFAKLFNNEVILDIISRSRLVNICKYLGITAHGADAYLRFMVQERLKRKIRKEALVQKCKIQLHTWRIPWTMEKFKNVPTRLKIRVIWELRLSCCYSYKDQKLQINNLTIHGIWPGHIVDGKVEHIINGETEIAITKPTAITLLQQLTEDYPDIRAKMDTHWTSTDHTSYKKKICSYSSFLR